MPKIKRSLDEVLGKYPKGHPRVRLSTERAREIVRDLHRHDLYDERLVGLMTGVRDPDDPKFLAHRRAISSRIQHEGDRAPRYTEPVTGGFVPGYNKGRGRRGDWRHGYADEDSWDNLSNGEYPTKNNVVEGHGQANDLYPQSYWPGDREKLVRPATGGHRLPKPKLRLLLKSCYAKEWRSGRKKYEIRKVSGS